MSLIPLICTHEVSATILSSILSTAYDASSKIDSPPNLALVTTTDAADLQKYTLDSITKPPVESSLQYPFLGWDTATITRFLQDNAPNGVLDHSTFLVADEQTAEDKDTLLLVHNVDDEEESIRLSAGWANSSAVAVSVASTDVGELESLADEDGVFRGGLPRPLPKKGGMAPRKRF